jgi:2-haloacid dehalogenase
MGKIHAVVLDACGTPLDVRTAMGRHPSQLVETWPLINPDWRQKLLEYTWVRRLAGPDRLRYFWQHEAALAWAAARYLTRDAAVFADVLSACRRPDPSPEAPALLRQIRDWELSTGILSNGEPRILADPGRSAGIAELLDFVLSVETVGVFKPTPTVYRLAEERLGHPGKQIAFVSSTAWDAFGAAFGFQVFWTSRTNPPEERAPAALNPRRAS